ncbi:hypothetical protein DFR28_101126 [Arenicella xantha]|uniref:Antitoxin Phd_YefM of type II toxin-antitoxin system n=2 Tax=Arenicella xantha TaxID=644221 RepID=A0A395JM75_9GAMM|nr:hypothetical protein DFR28_101126 [Arenicella xantha]
MHTMERIDYLTAQEYLARTMRRVCETEQAITIDGAGKDQVVMLPVAQYELIRQCLVNSSLSDADSNVAKDSAKLVE